MRSALFTLLTLAMLSSCGEQPNSNDQTKDSVVVTSLAKDTVYDPDTTDSIPGSAYLQPAVSAHTDSLVRASLQAMFKDDLAKNIVDDQSRSYSFFNTDLNDDGKQETFVALSGPYFCGTGGCNILLLDDAGKKITMFTVADLPVVIDSKKSNGYRDLFIQSKGKWHQLSYNGKSYPGNVSMQPLLTTIPGDGLPRALDMNDKYPRYRF